MTNDELRAEVARLASEHGENRAKMIEDLFYNYFLLDIRNVELVEQRGINETRWFYRMRDDANKTP